MLEVQATKKLFMNFIMPMILMTVRFQVEMIFRTNYIKFFSGISNSGKASLDKIEGEEPVTVKKAFRLMQGFITEILDPNLYYSRISFLESGKEAIDIKYELGKGKSVGFQQYKLPTIANQYYTRSSLIANLFENPAEGHVRARYSENLNNFKAAIKQKEIKNHCSTVRNIMRAAVARQTAAAEAEAPSPADFS
jgi:hypothetical protein